MGLFPANSGDAQRRAASWTHNGMSAPGSVKCGYLLHHSYLPATTAGISLENAGMSLEEAKALVFARFERPDFGRRKV
jgi:hypothetical protein